MQRRELLKAGVSALAAPMLRVGRCRLSARSARTFSTAAIDLVNESIVIDMLGLLTRDWSRLARWHENPASFSQADLAVLRSSGIAVFNPAVDLDSKNPYGDTRKWLNGWNRLLKARQDCFTFVSSCSDLEAAHRSGRIGVLLGMQNSSHFRTTADVQEFWNLGLRLAQLTYNGSNRIGHGCVSRQDHGLTEFGASIVRTMNRQGMIVDLSHCGERTTLDSIEESERPVLVTHSNCAALVPHPRCKSDEVIRQLAKKGGVMGVTAVRTFLQRPAGATVGGVLDHIEHISRIAGVEHAGIGSDIDASESAERPCAIAEGLLERKWKSSDIQLVLGGNFARAIGSVFR